MRYKAVLNNYMLGTYGKGVLRDMIQSQTRLDKSHTEVVLEIQDHDLNYVKKLLGADRYADRLQKVGE